jgi:hypothetical protein
MEKQTLTDLNPIITRQEIAQWYGIGVSGLRLRLRKKNLNIENRVLTLSDLKNIIACLGIPPNMPVEWQKILNAL